jgi:osmotically-inducible protein OsmY
MEGDIALVEQVTALLDDSPELTDGVFDVSASAGVVTLRGVVSTFDAKWLAERAALSADSVCAVVNLVEVLLPGLEQRSDHDIAAAVLHLIATRPNADSNRVVPVIGDGWVTLSGSVADAAEKTALRRSVAMILGVTGVTDELAVDDSATPTRIIAQIKGALKRACPAHDKAIEVELHGDTVILRGTVGSEAELEDAEWAAWAPAGVAHVENRLALAPAYASTNGR